MGPGSEGRRGYDPPAGLFHPVRDDLHDTRPRRHTLALGPGLDPRASRTPPRSETRTWAGPPTRRGRLHGHLRRPVRGRELAGDRGLLRIEARLAEHLPEPPGGDPLARHVPPRLLPPGPGGVPGVLLRLDDLADGSVWRDARAPGPAWTEAGRHRRKGPTRFGPTHRRPIAPAHG